MNEVQRASAKRKKQNYCVPFQPEAVKALLRRVCGDTYADAFTVVSLRGDGVHDAYRLSDAENGGLLLEATSGTAAASCLRRYLEGRCGAYIGLLTERLTLPARPPRVDGVIEGESPFLYRYFFNYCTFGYTTAFWDFSEWERFLDRLLLQGYNLILNPIGNETVWQNTLQSLGYREEDARAFLSAPVFYPWQCMMNLSGYGGAAPDAFYRDRVALAGKINERLESLGAAAVLPGYSGIVPDDFLSYFPHASLLRQGDWCNFKRPSLVSYCDPLFGKIADTYYTEQKKLFGSHPYFSVDPFHEGGNSSSVDMYAYGRVCYAAMARAERGAVWVLQGWSTNPNRKMLEALAPEDTLVVNLKSEVNIDGGDDFHHRPWLYGCVNNFGGRRVPRANLKSQYAGPHAALENPDYSAVGLALLPEGVELDEAAFDIFADNAFEVMLPSFEAWQADYLRRRYGKVTPALSAAFRCLSESIYIHDTSATPKESPFSTRPSLSVRMITPACGTDAFTYHPKELLHALSLFVKELPALRTSVQYRFDLCELLRQAVALTGWGVLERAETAFQKKDKDAFLEAKADFMTLFSYLEGVLADSPVAPFSHYIESARRYGSTAEEKAYFGGIFKTLITAWGDASASEILHDYAAREWSGMPESFYRPRWERYFAYIEAHLEEEASLAELDLAFPHYEIERAFCDGDTAVPPVPAADFAYTEDLLLFCEKLLSEQKISVVFRKQVNAMELK